MNYYPIPLHELKKIFLMWVKNTISKNFATLLCNFSILLQQKHFSHTNELTQPRLASDQFAKKLEPSDYVND